MEDPLLDLVRLVATRREYATNVGSGESSAVVRSAPAQCDACATDANQDGTRESPSGQSPPQTTLGYEVPAELASDVSLSRRAPRVDADLQNVYGISQRSFEDPIVALTRAERNPRSAGWVEARELEWRPGALSNPHAPRQLSDDTLTGFGSATPSCEALNPDPDCARELESRGRDLLLRARATRTAPGPWPFRIPKPRYLREGSRAPTFAVRGFNGTPAVDFGVDPGLPGSQPPPGLGGCLDSDCCPTGHPNYQPVCQEGVYYYYSGNQLHRVPSPETAILESPWRHVGHVCTSNSTGTGILIGPNHVLTAAHVFDRFDPACHRVSFALARDGECFPYGLAAGTRVYVPQQYIDAYNTQSLGDEEARAHDWAVIEIDSPNITKVAAAPTAVPWSIVSIPAGPAGHVLRATGYPCGADFPPPGLPVTREEGALYQTADVEEAVLESHLAFDDGTGLLKARIEGAGGMSGGPVWFQQAAEPRLVGVFVGSPGSECSNENWAASLTLTTRARILSAMGLSSVTPEQAALCQYTPQFYYFAWIDCPLTIGPGDIGD